MRRSIINLIVGIVLASTAVFLMSQYKGSYNVVAKIHKPNLEVVKVVVANRDLPFGGAVLRDYLEYTDWPKKSVPEGVFTDMEEILKDENGEDGKRVAVRSILKGEPIYKQKISGFGGKSTLSRKVSKDKRAVSISINDVSGVAGFLLPGDHVDVMLTRKADSESKKLITDVILQNVIILGIDQLTDESSDKPVIARTATVEVEPLDAQKLALAQQIGTLSLSLRHHDNNDEASVARVSVNDLSGEIQPKSKTKTKSKGPRGHFVNVRRGTDLNSTRVPD